MSKKHAQFLVNCISKEGKKWWLLMLCLGILTGFYTRYLSEFKVLKTDI
tara:strand:- start:208 stop:354 length:147 start_codon:yes stop_codon:yes gene_type:complete